MNFDFYLLGSPNGYDQYPLDDKASLFQSFHETTNADTQLTIYRKTALVYYVYTKKLKTLGGDQFFGLSIVLNGVYIANVTKVFAIFEQLCSNIVVRGKILRADASGKIDFVHSHFADDVSEIEALVKECRKLVDDNLYNDIQELPIERAAHTKATTVSLADTFDAQHLYEWLKEYTTIHILKEEDENNGYIDTIITNLYQENKDLKEQYQRLNSQKKQYKIVIILLLVLMLLGGGLYFLNTVVVQQNTEIGLKTDTIHNQQFEIHAQDQTIRYQQDQNTQLENRVTLLGDSISRLINKINSQQSIINQKEDEVLQHIVTIDGLKRFQSKVTKAFPIIISDVEVGNFERDGSLETDYGGAIYQSYSSMLQPRLKIYGLQSDWVRISMKLYTPSGRLWRDDYSPYDCSRSASIQAKQFVQKSIATSDFRVGGGRGYWSRGEYRMEFWYNDKICLYTATFTIR